MRRAPAQLLSLIAISFLAYDPCANAAERPSRVTSDLQVYYTFPQSRGDVIPDQSGAGEPLNLRIDKPQGALFRQGKMSVTSSVVIASDGSAKKLGSTIKQSNELTIEAWLKPLDQQQAGPARVVSLSVDPSKRNFTLGQNRGRWDVRLRTTSTDENGIPSTASPEGAVDGKLAHVVFTRTVEGTARLWINGKTIAEKMIPGTFANWSDDFRLSIGNELTGDRPWLGDVHLVAVYSRALTDAEIAQNYAAGIPIAVDYAAILPPAATRRVDFVQDVQPILRKHCYECHSGDHEDGGVNLGIGRRARQGGNEGPLWITGESAQSRLIHLVAAVDGEKVMPPETGGLNREEVGILRAWIDQGVVWPSGTDVADAREERAKTHWAFQSLRPVELPAVKNSGWARTPIDRFILARQEAAGITTSPPTENSRLIRRLSFKLTGLPPSWEAIENFRSAAERDPTAAAEALVDQLLQSPHYGERWGRHWLDVARYADSDGQESDRDRPTAYHYRDFVIRAFNEDMPYDRFIRWQLAGDEYAPANPQAVAATGFLAAGPFAALPDRLMEDERLRNRYNELDDMISTIGTGLLGLTLGCVRCHDHKYDAIPARDYYGLMSAFHGGERAEVPLGSSDGKVLGYHDRGASPAPTWLFQRGNYYDRDQPISLGFVSILMNGKSVDEYWQTARQQSPQRDSSQQRRALAEWMTDVDQGAGALLARVMVNRVWMHHFGQGLVRTAGDFGVRSEPPTHPELLEWLANDFVQHGWSVKRLQRLIALSAVSQQTGGDRSPLDPDNRLLGTMPMDRLEGEILRDAMLAVSGTLNLTAYGPAVKPPIAAEAMLARNLKDGYPAMIDDSAELRRRSVYLFHKRVVPYPLLQVFDKPDAQQSCSRRDNTTVAPQALALLNDPFVRTVSLEFADRVLKESGDEPMSAITTAYRLALGRTPTEAEQSAASTFLAAQQRDRQDRDPSSPADEVRRRAVADLCQVLFGLNEFLYVD